ncbi:hypothetical protein ALC57_00307 [Trachymyrmex cornetzi]|uniref:Uncharacterized protein n=1 Tax=Trachymyrmex cornetzi TaxID=471704 RepID=A0A151JS88_9HYME|nr:hypothetical protein ALC57_00307 [Trachymyrmex cornetzi]
MLATGCYANLGATSAQAKLADSYFKTISGQGWVNVGSMSATGGDANHGATLAQRTLADSYLLTKFGPTSSQRWQHVGNRWSRQSRRDVGPTYVSRPLPTDNARANVGSTSAIGCHTNLGATSAQRMLGDTYLLTKLEPTLSACR